MRPVKFRTPAIVLGLISISAISLSAGCYLRPFEELLSRPSIKPNSEWKLEEGCGYERCGGTPADFLRGKGLTIRLAHPVRENSRVFLIIAAFFSERPAEIEINPSEAFVDMANGKRVYSQGVRCSGRVFDVEGGIRRDVERIRSTVRLQAGGDDNCLYFVFDSPPPTVGEIFRFHFNAKRDGKDLEIPEITFSPVLTKY